MRILLAPSAAASLLLSPAAALACGGGGMEALGTAAFRADGTITALAARSSGYRWIEIGEERVRLGEIDATQVFDAPRARTSGERLLVRVEGGLFELTGGRSRLALPGIVSFDAAPGKETVVAATLGDGQGGTDLVILDDGLLGDLEERGRVPATGACDPWRIAVARQTGGAVAGLCGEVPFRLEDGALVLDAPLGIGALGDLVSAGQDADGAAVFFGVQTLETPYRTRLLAMRRSTAGAWTAETIAELPVGYSTEGGLAAGSAVAGAVAGFTEDGTFTLHAFGASGGGWTVEPVGEIAFHDRLSASGDADSLRILAGAYRLSLFERDASGAWTETKLGKIGYRTPAMGCSIADTIPSPSAGAALLGIGCFAVVCARARRLRSTAG